MSTAPKILLFHASPTARQISVPSLEVEGMECFEAHSEEVAIRIVRKMRPDLLLVNSRETSESLWECVTRLKAARYTRNLSTLLIFQRDVCGFRGNAPVIEDCILAERSDCDLSSRIRAVLRREKPDVISEKVSFRDMQVDMVSHRVVFSGGSLSVPPQILRLFTAMFERPDKIWSRQELMDWVWGAITDLNIRLVDTLISRARKILDGRTEVKILSVRGLGYRLS